ncbi:glycosyl hydrolase [Dyadobacter psychrophilus]|uniref:Glycosyl hydrolases family 2, sugar binding domain n=1 Tax=Dyadobacter psychrophilus TaxID=651661 RepID=A0A1T5BW49_9BACT|nr:glycosyl hydrolase [Dyadobacter psychrophilus]SKB51548.1 Glycosyl hydrolases family 2, sugar binding domain [Dyadobacter psychrophilus]
MKQLYSRLLICLIYITIIAFSAAFLNKEAKEKEWFPYYDFDPGVFQSAPRAYGPLTRWWLPGNDISSEELQREIRMFADNGFAGVEVQPLTQGLNPKAPKGQHDRVYSWDTPSYYAHIAALMEQAKKSKVIVDMNGGSGWPLGGSFFDPKESMKTLAVSDTILNAGQSFQGALPKPGNHAPKATGMMAAMMTKNFVDDKWAVPLSIIAARVEKVNDHQTVLEPKTIVDLSKNIHNGTLDWKAPDDGKWQIVVTWKIPSGEKPSLIASEKNNYVIDHLDPAVVAKTYEYLLGRRTGLNKYHGKPMRAIFNDSYEFHTDRIISADFLNKFKTMNGYDITPYLASVFQKGYDHPVYLASMYAGAKPPVVFNEKENWRMMYDYDRTVNEVFKKNFIGASNSWLGSRGMLHRTQAYGFPIDVIGAAGSADIPEAEQLFAEGSEGYLKLVTSGAHLNNKPVITQESFVSILRAEMTTPQKIKMWADKSLACGINQLIYHGTPYKYNNGEYGAEGWNTWSSPFLPFVNFSTGMNETDPFWKDVKQINAYLARCQYALRAGKPKTDVLIYMPFVDFTEDQLATNPEEILERGYLKGIEPDIQGFGVFKAPDTRINRWYKKLWPIINELEANGITWEFVNEESLQKATSVGKDFTIAGNNYQALIVANLPFIGLRAAQKINTMTKAGAAVWMDGALPEVQPSYRDFEANDKLVKQMMEETASQKTAVKWDSKPYKSIEQKINFTGKMDFSRQIVRQMEDGSEVRFFWNKSDKWQTLELKIGSEFKDHYWMNAENGQVTKGQATAAYDLAPYGSVILYATSKNISESILSPPVASSRKATEMLKVNNWTLGVGKTVLSDQSLKDWRQIDDLKFTSGDGIYRSKFNVQNVESNANYFLDLGQVYYTAEVMINGKPAGKRLFTPFELNITKLLKSGENEIEVKVTTSRRNGFIGEAVKENPLYLQFKGQEKTTVPAGLVGPVIIKKL